MSIKILYHYINNKYVLIKILLKCLLIIVPSISFISCNSTKNTNKTLTIKVINNLTNKPIQNGYIEVRIVKKPILSRWQYIKVFETKTDTLGIARIELDSTRRYRISIDYKDGSGAGFDEFEAKGVDFNKVYEIRCLDDSEKKLNSDMALMRYLKISIVDNFNNPYLGKVKIKKIYYNTMNDSSFEREKETIETDSLGAFIYYTNKTGKIHININNKCIHEVQADTLNFNEVYKIRCSFK